MAPEMLEFPRPLSVKLQAPFKVILPGNVPCARRMEAGFPEVPVTVSPSKVKVQLSQVKPSDSIYKPAASHLKERFLPAGRAPISGRGKPAPLLHLRMYPLPTLSPSTSTVKRWAAVTLPGLEVVLVFTSTKLGVILRAERAVTINLEFRASKVKSPTRRVPPFPSAPSPPPILPLASTRVLALLISPVPPKKPPPDTNTLPLKDFLFPLRMVFPPPVEEQRNTPAPAIPPLISILLLLLCSNVPVRVRAAI